MSEAESGSEDAAAAAPVLFPFMPSERDLIERLAWYLRTQLSSMSAYEIRNVSTFLFALERLPYSTPDVCISVSREVREGRELAYIDVAISGDYFRLSTGGYVHDASMGGDSYGQSVFEVETDGFRAGGASAFERWLEAFEDFSGEWRFDNAGDDELDLQAELPDDGWSRLE